MKKTALATLCAALLSAATLHAATVTGPITVTRNGSTNTTTATVDVAQNDNGLYTLKLTVPLFGTMVMSDVPAVTAGGITVFTCERNVSTVLGTMRTVLMARMTGSEGNEIMAADVKIPDHAVTMWFNTVGDYFQMPNSDMEAWSNSSTGEPDRWHGFNTAKGGFASMSAGIAKLEQSSDVRSGAEGQYSAVMTAGSFWGIVGNGTMTNGRLNAGSMSATDTKNHAEMSASSTETDPNGYPFYMPLYAKPDALSLWIKYVPKNSSDRASVSAAAFNGDYYQEPYDNDYACVAGRITGGASIAPCGWTQMSFPFDYATYQANNAEANSIFVTFSTNSHPGSGSSGDAVYVDDIALVYLAQITDLRYRGATVEGWNAATRKYNLTLAEVPTAADFTADVTGASAVLTKTIEQTGDGTWRVTVSAVSGDLQTAPYYILNITVESPVTVVPGDVDGNGMVDPSDISALIDHLLNGAPVNEANADIDQNGTVDPSDISALIDFLLNG